MGYSLLGPSGSEQRSYAPLGLNKRQVHLYDNTDVTSEPGDHNIAMVFQDYALYPHMSVEENIGYPLGKKD